MAQLAETRHVESSISDYTLGLLSAEERESVAAHLSSCSECRRAMVVEQNFVRAVKETFVQVPAPDPERIRRLMPISPETKKRKGRALYFSPGFAAASIMMVLLFSALALFAVQRPGSWTFSAPTADSTAIVLTHTPTLTATREVTVTSDWLGTSTAPGASAPSAGSFQTQEPAPAVVPVPAAALLN